MKQLSLSALAVCLSLGCGAALAEDKPAPKDDGVSLMEEGARLLFRGLMSEMEPAISGMSEALQEMEPAIKELVALIDDFRNYEAPRILENGDILIPRRPGAPPAKLKPDPAPPLPDAEGQIEL